MSLEFIVLQGLNIRVGRCVAVRAFAYDTFFKSCFDIFFQASTQKFNFLRRPKKLFKNDIFRSSEQCWLFFAHYTGRSATVGKVAAQIKLNMHKRISIYDS